MYEAGGVAMSNSGDCWVDAKPTSTGGANLIYFKGCSGGGKVATGFKNTYYGDVDIDNKGNLVIIDEMALAVYIYSGCNPACKVVGGPFPLKAESFFGRLNARIPTTRRSTGPTAWSMCIRTAPKESSTSMSSTTA